VGGQSDRSNAALKGGYVDVTRGFFRVFGLVKISVLLGFTIAAVNLDRIRSYEAKRAELQDQPNHRKKRRVGTWSELIGHLQEVPANSTGPPG
jgi:hypothetical protein